MSAPRIYGWCPGALRPMMSGDGLVVRIRTPLGRLSQAQAKGVAKLSNRFGNGLLDLSARANLQLRGVHEGGHEDLVNGLRDLELVDPDVTRETRRNVVVQPFWSKDDTTHKIAGALSQALTSKDAPDLPGKFGFAVDCGADPVLSDISADIRIEQGLAGLICRPDGSTKGIPVTEDTAADTALTMAHWFLRTGGAPDGRGRMAKHSARVGVPDTCDADNRPGIGHPGPGATDTGLLVALEFGQMQADTLADLAEHGALRLTPWRMLLVESADHVGDVPGLITDPADPRLTVTACTGAPGCRQALSSTRDVARLLAGSAPGDLHVSGCTKGCAHPGPSARTLIATGQNTFDLIRNGRTTDTPVRKGLSLSDLQSGEL